jgi:hypothetical protein
MDDPANRPVLVHCRAGLHRTGTLAALYRMEYEHWSLDQALQELLENGFGMRECTSRNQYILQYLLIYRPRDRNTFSSAVDHGPSPAAPLSNPPWRTDHRLFDHQDVTDHCRSPGAARPW